MKTVAIMSVGDYRHITLISKYTDYFDEHSINYVVICTDRYDDPSPDDSIMQYRFASKGGKLRKALSFLTFRMWACKQMKSYEIDFIVVWNENTALLFWDYLLLHFWKKYCVNIRDVDFLPQRFFNIFRCAAIKGSEFSTYCSTAKLDFPKNYQYVMLRSMNYKVLRDVAKRDRMRFPNEPIRIAYVGKFRFIEAAKQIIDAFGNDSRYEISFIGVGSESLSEYVSAYSNVSIIGRYAPEETAGFLNNIDVINSYFGTDVFGHERMTSIRFMYAPYMHVPVIVGKGTEMEAEGNKFGFAFGFDCSHIEDEANRFYDWYSGIDAQRFIDSCESYCARIEHDDLTFYSKLDSVFDYV